ncbi:hypothetical protein BU24DRAFT_234420 [Aaosphaeria arxii CBS 175.79]|uniref:Uncharacterized protein n=1 Tax=Aaosphaeria arxii CBS 175.79 TaxID=1450172 RepID=A0A6A5XJ53_9PLEO|nr:uncharacterized protein BU24DRAFT_234420 [Aaosphaeria arxii CBS 175.79]KAF2013295.1 hypothetical protein BU24DRAFT_234420 [Aaosphaeria arxii CBS 175.79]
MMVRRTSRPQREPLHKTPPPQQQHPPPRRRQRHPVPRRRRPRRTTRVPVDCPKSARSCEAPLCSMCSLSFPTCYKTRA